MLVFRRKEYLVDLADANRDLQQRNEVAEGQGNCYSSEVDGRFYKGMHAPAIDIDGINVEVHPSSTEGNFHLYIDKPMSWEEYKKILAAFYNAGLIQDGFYTLSLARGATFLRKPGVKKNPGEEDS